MPGAMKPQLSLKGRALQLLAQREHSRLELRRKLLRRLRDDARRDAIGEQGSPADRQAEVEAVLDWLQAHRYLSDERFVESRVHARASRFGNLRIRSELQQHGVAASAAQAQHLRDTEAERAFAVWQRRFAAPPGDAAAAARQSRFLAGRGFTPEAIRAALRRAGRAPADDA